VKALLYLQLVWSILAVAAYAQQGVALYIDPHNKGADTLDFGYVFAGDTVVRALYIENATDGETVIPQGTRPYFWIEATPPYRENDPDEFPLEALFPFRIGSGTIRTYPLRYAATLFEQLHPDGRHQVALNVTIRRSEDTSTILASRRFVLRATKSFRPLWSDVQRIWFDSVYINSPLDRAMLLQVRNVRRAGVPVQIIRQGDSQSLRAFTIDADPSDYFSSEQLKEYTVHFQPSAPALYALDLLFVHPSPLRNGGPDTTTIQLRGVGVTQRLAIRQVLGRNVAIVGDTVIARHRKVGVRDTIAIVVENVGNIAIGAVETQLDGDTRQYTLLRGMQNEFRLAPKQYDTIVIAVHPLQPGTSRARVDVLTDLLQRGFWGVPTQAAASHFTLMVESLPPQLVALTTNGVHDVGAILSLGTCTERQRDTITLRNESSNAVTITAFDAPVPFRVVLSPPITIYPGQTLTIPIEIYPMEAGTYSGTLRIESTDTAYSPLEVPLHVRFIQPPPPKLRIPSLEYVPGKFVTIPIVVDTTISLYSAVRVTISFDPTMMQVTGVHTAGTATQGATTQLVSLGQGQYRIQISTPTRLFQRDTLIILLGQTFLGQMPSSPIAIVDVHAGNATCPDAVTGDAFAGMLRVAPFCGMSYKFPITLPSIVILGAQGDAYHAIELECWSQEKCRGQAVLFSTDGRIVSEWTLELDAGLRRYPLPLRVPQGIYAIRVNNQQTSDEARCVVLVR